MLNKISFGNVIKHRWSSLIILTLFAVSSFVIYWAFGFTNRFTSTISDSALKNNGHLAYQIDFISKEASNSMFNMKGISEIVLERRIGAASTSKKESGMLMIGELTPKYKESLKNVKMDFGRLPQTEDEIALTSQYDETKLSVGDSIYVTTFTPEKIVNTMKYKVVGIGKIGDYSMITPSSMDTLVNSNNFFNTAVFYASGKLSENSVDSLDEQIRAVLLKNKIKIEESSNYYKSMRENEALLLTFKAMKIVLLTVMFPLTGAVLGALVWIHSFKRRKELWTYHSMGFKDRQIIKIVRNEYLLIALFGTVAGICAGAVSSMISEKVNGMLSFTYIMNMEMVAKIGFQDILFIFLFMALNTIFWMRFPVNKIIKSKPFSY